MKRKFLSLALCSILVLGYSSCHKDDDNEPENNEPIENPTNDPTQNPSDNPNDEPKEQPVTIEFSKQTQEEIIADITKSGVDETEKLYKIYSSNTMQALINFVHLQIPQNAKTKKAQSFFKGRDGEYVYSETNGFTFTPNEKVQGMVYKFPATEDGKTNNATLTLTYKDSNKQLPKGSPLLYPENLNVELEIDNKTSLTGTVKATYATINDLPETIAIDVVMDEINKLTLNLDLSNRKSSLTGTITSNNEQIASVNLKLDNKIGLNELSAIAHLIRSSRHKVSMPSQILYVLSLIKGVELEAQLGNLSAKFELPDGSIATEFMEKTEEFMPKAVCEEYAKYFNNYFSGSVWFNDTNIKVFDLVIYAKDLNEKAEAEESDKPEQKASEEKADEFALSFGIQCNDKIRPVTDAIPYFIGAAENFKKVFKLDEESDNKQEK